MRQENVLAKMFSDITGLDYEILKDNIILEVNELPISKKSEIAKKCDFILRIDKDNIINLELNHHSYTGMIVKNLSYLFKLFSLSFKKGDEYNDNLVVTQININCFSEVKFDEIKPLLKYQIREEMNKLYAKNLDDFKDILGIISEIMTPKERKIFMDNLSDLTCEDLFYTEEEALEWAEWERKTMFSDARRDGVKMGREEGFKQGIEQKTKDTILSMLENNLSLELISKVTNKSIEEIKK